MPTTLRILIAFTILGSGLLLARFTGLPSSAPHWQLYAQAYRDMVTVTRAEFRADKAELRVRAESRIATYPCQFGNTIFPVLTATCPEILDTRKRNRNIVTAEAQHPRRFVIGRIVNQRAFFQPQ